MKKALSLLMLLMLALTFASTASAGFRGEEDGTREGEFIGMNLSTGLDGSKSGNTYTVSVSPALEITSVVFEGSTADASETTLAVIDPTGDNTFTLPDASGTAMISSLSTNNLTAANSVFGASNALVFEGATADGFELSLSPADPAADVTLTMPAVTGTLVARTSTVVITAGASPTLTVPTGLDFIATDTITTDNQDQTITFSAGGTAGQKGSIVFQTDSGGSGDEVITFQTTLTNTAGTLTLANLTAGRYVVNFQSDGTVWNETSRTAALS